MFGRKKKLAIAVQALTVYAAEDFWKRSGTTTKGNYQPAPYTADHGNAARAALKLMRMPASLLRSYKVRVITTPQPLAGLRGEDTE